MHHGTDPLGGVTPHCAASTAGVHIAGMHNTRARPFKGQIRVSITHAHALLWSVARVSGPKRLGGLFWKRSGELILPPVGVTSLQRSAVSILLLVAITSQTYQMCPRAVAFFVCAHKQPLQCFLVLEVSTV